MTLFTHRLNPVNCLPAGMVVMAVCVLMTGFVGQVSAQQAGADSLEVQELKTAVAVLKKQLQAEKDRNAGLPARGKEGERSQREKVLLESLAEANRVAETTRAEYEELLLRMASFGVDLLKPDSKSLEQRLLKVVRERDLAEQEKEKLAGQLLRLSEAAANFSQYAISGDGELRRQVNAQVAAANQVLGLTTSEPAPEKAVVLAEGRVVSVDPEIGLIVLNVGRKSGVRIGMPLQVLRTDRPIGSALVVDARDTISGAVLQDLIAAGDDVKVGDRIKPQAQQL